MTLAFSPVGRQQSAQDQDRQHIISVLDQENERVSAALEELYACEGENQAASIMYCQRILASVDNVEASGDWESSLFLRNVLKPLREVADKARAMLQELQAEPLTVETVKQAIADHQLLIYVALYNAQGDQLTHWQSQLDGIDSYITGRPIYLQEDQVKKAIRLKGHGFNGAYAILLIEKDAIERSTGGEQRTDRYGQPLVMLKAGAVDAANIIEFSHDGVHYRFNQGQLKNLTEVK